MSSAHLPPNALTRLPALRRRLLGQRPCGLFTDIDGTLSDIAWPPERAVVSAACRRGLERLVDRFDLVAAVSGRSAPEAREMVGLDDLTYIGLHGLEEIASGHLRVAKAAKRAATILPALVAQVVGRLGCLPGLYLERKTYGLAVHFRTAENPQAARQAVLAVLSSTVDAAVFDLVEGRKVVEVRPRARIDKGTAVRRLIRRHGLKAAIYLGDDITDVDAFRAIQQLKRRETLDGMAIVVASQETPPEVSAAADLSLDSVDQVACLLESLAQARRL